MVLGPVNASPLQGQTHKLGKELTVTDPSGRVVVRAALGKAAAPAYAVIETANGEWHIERRGRSDLAVLDPGGVV
jgi:hypothetical protein